METGNYTLGIYRIDNTFKRVIMYLYIQYIKYNQTTKAEYHGYHYQQQCR